MTLSKDLALQKMQAYCAYQDRCHSEVRTKLLSLKIYGDDLEEIISSLIEDQFLDELRFAKSYARGKFRMKRWGRNKIRQQLELKKVSAYCIRKGLLEIEDEAYRETLESIIRNKWKVEEGTNSYEEKIRVQRYAISRGYEWEWVQEVMQSIVEE